MSCYGIVHCSNNITVWCGRHSLVNPSLLSHYFNGLHILSSSHVHCTGEESRSNYNGMLEAYMAAVGSLEVLHQSACLVMNCLTSCVSVVIMNSLAKSNSLKSVYISTAWGSCDAKSNTFYHYLWWYASFLVQLSSFLKPALNNKWTINYHCHIW